MRIYLAGSFSRKDELTGYWHDVERETIHTITSRWLTDEHMPFWRGAMPYDMAQVAALNDFEDVVRSHAIIAFTDDPAKPRGGGGRHVEFGIASHMGLPIYIVGPREHVFHCLPHVIQFATWEDCLSYLKELP